MSRAAAAGRKKQVLFLFSDTAGGHRAPAEAVIEALGREFPGTFDSQMVDFFGEYCPRPLAYAPELLRPKARLPRALPLPYRASDGTARARAFSAATYPYVRRAMKRLLADHPADLIVSMHPLVNQTVMRAMRRAPRPYLTVVTDLVSPHAFWFDRRADLVVVPTPQAAKTATRCGIPTGNLRVVGLPVRADFTEPGPDRDAWRAAHGWDADRPVVLLSCGADGIGPIKKLAKAIDGAELPVTLVIMCGRNAELVAELSQRAWRTPTHVHGFVDDWSAFMAAADIFVTKAGAAAITEAFVSGLPMVLFTSIRGHQDGNVAHVLRRGAGVWAPRPRAAVAAVRSWVEDPNQRAQAAAASAASAQPQAARDVARVIADQLGIRRRRT
ncbi:MAG: glycosyltransferase [Propionibacteriales bacterium]|nr:glycosyltransferase [Propionibacteriales bacterium]